jgi:hypothetical protein
VSELLPRSVARFSQVVDALHREGAPAGFRRARDMMFEQFEVLAKRMPPYVILKLAIEFDRHALFNEVASDKARTSHDAEAYDAYQRYLAGETDVPVAAGLPLSVQPQPDPTRVPFGDSPDAEESDDGERDA